MAFLAPEIGKILSGSYEESVCLNWSICHKFIAFRSQTQQFIQMKLDKVVIASIIEKIKAC